MTAADFVKREMEIAKEVTAENPGADIKKLQTLTGIKINQERIKVLNDAGYPVSEICDLMGLTESVVRREISRSKS